MSRFRREHTLATRDMLPLDQQNPQTKLVPVTAEDAARAKRNKMLAWAGVALGALALILAVQKVSSKPAQARNYLADARRHFEAGKYSDALTSADLAMRESRNRLEAYRLRVAIYRSVDRRADAYEDVSRLIKLEPQVADNYRTRAQLALDMDEVKNAIADYTILIDRHRDPAAYTGRAMCYRKLGETGKMIADLDASIEREPDVENCLQRGLAHELLGEHRKAIADYDRAAAIDPNSAQVYRARAYARQAIGDAPGAKSDADRAFTLESPRQPMEK